MIPAICSTCGTVFGSTNAFGGSGSIELVDVGIGPCPKCGGMGNVPDGVYGLRDDTTQVVRSSGIRPDVLQGIVGLLEALQRGEASKSQVVSEVEREAPELRQQVERALSHPNTATWVAILIQIILSIISMSNHGPGAHEIAEELRSEPISTYSVQPPASTPRPGAPSSSKPKRKHRPKQHGKTKQRKSRKRR